MPLVELATGITVNCRIAGAGFPLVFVHGWAMSGAVWASQEELGQDYRLVMPDLRGHGRSSAPPAGYGFDDLADDLAGLFARLEMEKAIVIGWSMGGQILLQAIPRIRSRLAGAVLVSATPRFTRCDGYPHGLPLSAVRGLAAAVRRNRDAAVAGFRAGMFAADETQVAPLAMEVPKEQVLLAALDTLAGSDLRLVLPAADVPVLLVHGSADDICLPSASRYLAETLPDATLEIIAGAGHAPFLSRPRQFNRLLREFVVKCQCT